jgi:hypothetical protein
MVRRAVQGAIGLVGVLSFCYVAFFVPVGRRTLWQHAVAIAATAPARELGRDLVEAGEHVGREVRGAATTFDHDAGTSPMP